MLITYDQHFCSLLVQLKFQFNEFAAYVLPALSILIDTLYFRLNGPLKKSSNIPEIYAKMFGRFH